MSRIYWVSRGGRRGVKSVVEGCGSAVKLQLIKGALRTVEEGGISAVAVKCLDIRKKTYSEGSSQNCN